KVLHGQPWRSSRNRPCTGRPHGQDSSFSQAAASGCSRGNTGRRRERRQRESDGGLQLSWLIRQPSQSSRSPRSEPVHTENSIHRFSTNVTFLLSDCLVSPA